jgi:hypothetical protein
MELYGINYQQIQDVICVKCETAQFKNETARVKSEAAQFKSESAQFKRYEPNLVEINWWNLIFMFWKFLNC